MVGKTFTYRLTAEGITELEAQLHALGPAGDAAFARIAQSSPQMANALDQARAKADAARASLEQLAKADLAASFHRLQESLDPALARFREFERNRLLINEAERAGIPLEGEAAAASALLAQRYAEATASGTAFNGVLGTMGVSLRTLLPLFSAGAVLAFGKSVFDSEASLVDQARVAGVSISALQAYRAAMEDSGRAAHDADPLIARLTERIGEAKSKAGEARSVLLGTLNLNDADLFGPPEQVIDKIVASLGQMQDQSLRNAAADALVGRNWKDLIAILPALIGGLDQYLAKLREHNRVLDDDTVNGMHDAEVEMSKSWGRLKIAAAPVIQFVADGLAGWLMIIGEVASKLPDAWTAIKAGLGLGSDYETALVNIAGVLQKIEYAQKALASQDSVKGIEEFQARLVGLRAELARYRADLAKATPPPPPAPPAPPPKPTVDLGAAEVHDRVTALNEEVRISKLAADEQTFEKAIIRDANEYLKQRTGHLVSNFEAAKAALGAHYAELEPMERALATSKATVASAHEHVATVAQRNTLEADVLPGLERQAAVAGLARRDRERELQLLTLRAQYGAEFAAHEEQVKSLLDTIARGPLLDHIRELEQEAGLAGETRDIRAQELEIVRLRAQYGKILTSDDEDRIRAAQRIKDLTAGADTIANLQEQVSLAGLMPDIRAQEEAVLTAIHQTHGQITQDQRDAIRNLVAINQETARWQQSVTGAEGAIKSTVRSILDGKFSTESVTDFFKNEFSQAVAGSLQDAFSKPIATQLHDLFKTVGLEESVDRDALTASISAGNLQLANEVSAYQADIANHQAAGAAITEEIALRQQLTAAIQGNASAAASGAGGVSGIANAAGGNGFGGLGDTLDKLGTKIGDATDSLGNSVSQLSSAAGGIGDDISKSTSKMAASEAAFLSQALGIIGQGMAGAGYGSIASSLTGGTSLGGSIGGALGSIAGNFILPGIGGPIGGLIGGAIGGLFGNDTPSNATGYATFHPGGSPTFGGSEATSQTIGLVTQAANSVTGAIADLTKLGVTFTDSVAWLAAGTRDPGHFALASTPGTKLTGGAPGDAAGLAAAVVQELLKSANIESEALKSVLQTHTFGSVDELEKAAHFVADVYDTIASGRPELTQVEQAMEALKASFADASTQAQALGLDVNKLIAGNAAAFDENTRLALLKITDPLAAALELEARDAEARLDAARQFGADIAQVEALNAAEREQIIKQFAAQTVNDLQSLINDLTFGSGSAAAPDQRYADARAAYDAAAARATATNAPEDIQAFEQAARDLIPIAREFLGSSQQYGDLASQIIALAEQLGGMALTGLGLGAGDTGTSTGGDTGTGTGTGGDTGTGLGGVSGAVTAYLSPGDAATFDSMKASLTDISVGIDALSAGAALPREVHDPDVLSNVVYIADYLRAHDAAATSSVTAYLSPDAAAMLAKIQTELNEIKIMLGQLTAGDEAARMATSLAAIEQAVAGGEPLLVSDARIAELDMRMAALVRRSFRPVR